MKVSYFDVYPGFQPGIVTSAVDSGIEAIVIGCYCCGTFPSKNGLPEAMKYAVDKQVPVFLLSGTQEADEDGISFHLVYDTQVLGIEAGAIPLEFPNKSNCIEVIGYLNQLVEEKKTPEEVEKEMVAKYCSPGFYKRLEKERKHLLHVIQ